MTVRIGVFIILPGSIVGLFIQPNYIGLDVATTETIIFKKILSHFIRLHYKTQKEEAMQSKSNVPHTQDL